MTRILITGGAGFIGHHLAARLLSEGADVVVLDNLHRGSFERPELNGAELLFGDIRDGHECRAAATGCDAVVHLAAQSQVMGSSANPEYAYTTNVGGTWEVARAAADAGVRRLVFASSREVYGDQEALPVPEDRPLTPKNLYGASKVAGEAIVSALPEGGTSVAILRFANVVGPGDSGRVLPLWMECARKQTPLILFGGRQILDFVPIETAVEALLSAIRRPQSLTPTNVGSGIGITLRQLAARVLRETGSPSQIQFADSRGPEVERFTADICRMKALLGVVPPTDPLISVTRMTTATT